MHAKDNHWDRSSRAKAISAVRDARELTRRGKYGGYLDIHDSDDSDEDEVFIRTPFKAEHYSLHVKALSVIFLFYRDYLAYLQPVHKSRTSYM